MGITEVKSLINRKGGPISGSSPGARSMPGAGRRGYPADSMPEQSHRGSRASTAHSEEQGKQAEAKVTGPGDE